MICTSVFCLLSLLHALMFLGFILHIASIAFMNLIHSVIKYVYIRTYQFALQ